MDIIVIGLYLYMIFALMKWKSFRTESLFWIIWFSFFLYSLIFFSIRYVALNMLMKAVTVDFQAVQRHRTTILECVKVLYFHVFVSKKGRYIVQSRNNRSVIGTFTCRNVCAQAYSTIWIWFVTFYDFTTLFSCLNGNSIERCFFVLFLHF